MSYNILCAVFLATLAVMTSSVVGLIDPYEGGRYQLCHAWLKVGQIRPKWDKSGTFSDQISVHFELLKSDMKQTRICPIWG